MVPHDSVVSCINFISLRIVRSLTPNSLAIQSEVTGSFDSDKRTRMSFCRLDSKANFNQLPSSSIHWTIFTQLTKLYI